MTGSPTIAATNMPFGVKITRAATAMLLSALPFIHSGNAVDANVLPQLMALSAGLALLIPLIFLLSGSGESSERPGTGRSAFWIVGAALAFLAASGASLLRAPNPAEGLSEWVKLAAAALLGVTVYRGISRGILDWDLIAKSTAVAILGLSIHGLWQYATLILAPGGTSDVYQVTGTQAHKNFLSSAILFLLPFTATGMWRWTGIWRAMAFMGSALAAILILALQTRSVWLGAVAGSGCVVLSMAVAAARSGKGPAHPSHPMSRPNRTRMGLMVALAAAILGAGLWLSLAGRAAEEDTFTRIGAIVKPERNLWRTLIWTKTLDMVRDRPALGVGLGNWKISAQEYDLDEIRRGWEPNGPDAFGLQILNPHNDYLSVLSETGFAGFLPYLTLLVAIWVGAFRISLRMDPDRRLDARVLLAAITAYMVDSFFSFPKERISQLAALALMAGCVAALSVGGRKAVPASRRRWAAMPILEGAALASLFLATARFVSEIHVAKLLDARDAGDWPRVIAEAEKANSWCYPLDPFSIPIPFYTGAARYIQGDYSGARRDFEAAARLNPTQIHILNDQGAVEMALGRPDLAIAHFGRARALSPRFDEAELNLCEALLEMGDYAEAKTSLMRVPPDSDNPRVGDLSQRIAARMKETP